MRDERTWSGCSCFEPLSEDNLGETALGLHLVEFAQPIIRIVNTRFDGGSGAGNLESTDHGGSALDGVGLAVDGVGVGVAHDGDAIARVLEENGEDFFEAVGGDGAAEALEDIGVDDGVVFGIVAGIAVVGRGAAAESGAQAFGGERLFEDAVVSVELRRRGGAHSEKESTGRGLAERAGEIGAGESGHAEVGEDAVEQIGGSEVEGLLAAFGLEDNAAFGFQQDGRDGEADGVVIDGKHAAGSGGRPGIHDGTILHIDCDGFTVHLHGFNGELAGGALGSRDEKTI